MIKNLVVILLTIISMYARDSIIDTSKVLKDNQAIAIDAKTNSINYILEILPNGQIVKKHIDIKKQKQIIKELGLENISPSYDKTYKKNTPITTWDKKQIIYEQKIEKIYIER